MVYFVKAAITSAISLGPFVLNVDKMLFFISKNTRETEWQLTIKILNKPLDQMNLIYHQANII